MDWWSVKIEPSGQIEAPPADAATTAVLSKKAMGDLRRLIEKERLFDLNDSYGNPCPECSVCLLRVKLGTREKTIDVGTHIEAAENDREREELTRVMKVWDKVKELAGIAGREDACHAPDR